MVQGLLKYGGVYVMEIHALPSGEVFDAGQFSAAPQMPVAMEHVAVFDRERATFQAASQYSVHPCRSTC